MNTILHKRTLLAGREPGVNEIATGEFVMNSADGKVFIRKLDGTVIEITQPLYVIDGGKITSDFNTEVGGLLTEDGNYLFTETFVRIIVED